MRPAFLAAATAALTSATVANGAPLIADHHVALGQALLARVAVALHAGDQQTLDLRFDLVGLTRGRIDRRQGQAQGLDLLGGGLVGCRRGRAVLALIIVRRPARPRTDGCRT